MKIQKCNFAALFSILYKGEWLNLNAGISVDYNFCKLIVMWTEMNMICTNHPYNISVDKREVQYSQHDMIREDWRSMILYCLQASACLMEVLSTSDSE